MDLNNKSDVDKLTAVITAAVDAYLNSDAGQAAIRKAHPFPGFNVAADGQRHSLGTFLARLPGYQPFTPPAAKGTK